MSDDVVAICPSCSQKYRVGRANIGQRARCKKCGQTFKLLEEPPIDDETIFGWVTEDNPSTSSVAGGTGIFGQPFGELTHVPAHNGWVHPAPPDTPRVSFDDVDEKGAVFTFEPSLLRDPELRCSFPHRCAQCLGRDDLELHHIIWLDKVSGRDAALISETETRARRPLKRIMDQAGLNWFNTLKPIETMPSPFDAPFVYCVCPQCSVHGAVRARIVSNGGVELCQVIISHPSIALDFYRNNGGRETPGYKKLLVASRQRRGNQWKTLSVGIRIKIGQWYKPRGDEKFLGYFADRDFDNAKRGTSGVVLTDKRIIYKKYAALREYSLDMAGVMDIEASRHVASIEIAQKDRQPATLSTTPLAASSLARTLTGLNKHWKINVTTHA